MKHIDNKQCVFHTDVCGNIYFLEIETVGFRHFSSDGIEYDLMDNKDLTTKHFCKKIFKKNPLSKGKLSVEEFRKKPYILIPYSSFNEGINELIQSRLRLNNEYSSDINPSEDEDLREILIFRDNVEKALIDYFSQQC